MVRFPFSALQQQFGYIVSMTVFNTINKLIGTQFLVLAFHRYSQTILQCQSSLLFSNMTLYHRFRYEYQEKVKKMTVA